MGFLQKLFGKEARKTITNDGALKKTSSAAAQSRLAAGYDPKTAEQELRKRFQDILSQEWMGYEVSYDVIPQEFHAPSDARPYSICITRDHVPVGMIMFLHKHSEYRRMDVKAAQKLCEDHGVPYMNFMVYMSNRPEYISRRLKEQIKG